jgi:hypothetical protein
MRSTRVRVAWWRLTVLAAGATFILGGCDPQLRGTVEDGIITLSQSLLGSILQALIAVGQEATSQTASAISQIAPNLA